MEKTKCAVCGREGGKFVFRGDEWRCAGCLTGPAIRDTAHSTFPFTTQNLVCGKTLEIGSLRQLRALEREHGCHCAPYNFNSNNLER